MDKYVRVMYGTRSHAGGFEYKIGQVNETDNFNPKAENPKDLGGFNFSTESKILRWILRGDTLYDVELPSDAMVIETENKDAPHGVFVTNKIILSNPRLIDDDLALELYLKSDLPENSYFQCLTFLSLRNFKKVCERIILDKVNKENVENAFQTFSKFWEVSEEYRTDCYKEVWNKLMEIKNE